VTLAVAWVRSGVPWDACDLVSRAEALAEIDRHEVDGDRDAFLSEVGGRLEYMGVEAVEWLGC
jgi:hypothetical protein